MLPPRARGRRMRCVAAPRLLPLMSPRGALALGTCGFALEVLLLDALGRRLRGRERDRALHPARADLRRRPDDGLGAARSAPDDAHQRAALAGTTDGDIHPPAHPPHHPGDRRHGVPGAVCGGHGRPAAGRVLGRADRRSGGACASSAPAPGACGRVSARLGPARRSRSWSWRSPRASGCTRSRCATTARRRSRSGCTSSCSALGARARHRQGRWSRAARASRAASIRRASSPTASR